MITCTCGKSIKGITDIGCNLFSQGFEFTKPVLLLFLPIILFLYTF